MLSSRKLNTLSCYFTLLTPVAHSANNISWAVTVIVIQHMTTRSTILTNGSRAVVETCISHITIYWFSGVFPVIKSIVIQRISLLLSRKNSSMFKTLCILTVAHGSGNKWRDKRCICHELDSKLTKKWWIGSHLGESLCINIWANADNDQLNAGILNIHCFLCCQLKTNKHTIVLQPTFYSHISLKTKRLSLVVEDTPKRHILDLLQL